jgi:hypothetical protein
MINRQDSIDKKLHKFAAHWLHYGASRCPGTPIQPPPINAAMGTNSKVFALTPRPYL